MDDLLSFALAKVMSVIVVLIVGIIVGLIVHSVIKIVEGKISDLKQKPNYRGKISKVEPSIKKLYDNIQYQHFIPDIIIGINGEKKVGVVWWGLGFRQKIIFIWVD